MKLNFIKFSRKILLCSGLGWCISMSTTTNALGQGCSDAGICTLNSFKGQRSVLDPTLKNEFKAGFSTGAADRSISVLGASLGYSRKMGHKWGLDGRLTFLSQSGNKISVAGMSDIYANLNYHPASSLTVTAGVKVPLHKADRMEEGKALPMDYQSSLGTLDIYMGLAYRMEKWQWVIAYQQPLSQNDNAFFPSAFGPGSPLNSFQATNQFERKGDVLFRVVHMIALNDKIVLMPGLLPIYHLGEDEYTDEDEVVHGIEGSDGLTINGTLALDLRLQTRSSIQFNLGFPFWFGMRDRMA